MPGAVISVTALRRSIRYSLRLWGAIFLSFSSLEPHKPARTFADGLIQRRFQILLHILQLLPNGNALRAVLLTFAAADAVGGWGGIFPEGGAF